MTRTDINDALAIVTADSRRANAELMRAFASGNASAIRAAKWAVKANWTLLADLREALATT
jgi:hypothetical protein